MPRVNQSEGLNEMKCNKTLMDARPYVTCVKVPAGVKQVNSERIAIRADPHKGSRGANAILSESNDC